jgi:hypothetical protein
VIENNLSLMNGYTVSVVTNINMIPRNFKVIDDLEQMKATVSEDMGQNNLSFLIN